MNAWSEIVKMLVEHKEQHEVIISPNAPPVSRGTEEVMILSDRVFSANDVRETLVGAITHAGGGQPAELGQSGVLCVGMKNVGRIRVAYFTQRGSRILRIVKIPFDIPAIDSICVEPLQAREIVDAVLTHRIKVILVYGASQIANSTLAYAILSEINKNQKAVIHVVEPALSFLLAHDNCVVVQMEVGIDVPSLDDAIQQSLLLQPDVVYLGDIKMTDTLPNLPHLIGGNRCTILSITGEDPMLACDLLPSSLQHILVENDSGMLLHPHPDDNGKLQLETAPWRLPKPLG